MPDVRRGEFMTLLGGAAGWPLAAWAQQPAVPMVGFLDPRSLENECKASSARIPARPQGYRLSHEKIMRSMRMYCVTQLKLS